MTGKAPPTVPQPRTAAKAHVATQSSDPHSLNSRANDVGEGLSCLFHGAPTALGRVMEPNPWI